MASDPMQNVEPDQFKDAPIPIDEPQADPRAGGQFIDDDKLLEWSESENSADEDEDGIEEEYDDNRAEDEDWEIAEGGMTCSHYLKTAVNFPCRLYKTIQSPTPTCRSARRERSRRHQLYQ